MSWLPADSTTLDVDFDLPSSGYGVVSLHSRSMSPAAQAFMRILQEVEAELQQAEKPADAAKPRGSRRRSCA